MKHKNTYYFTFSLIIAIIIAINVLSNQFFLRLDFTADKRYTISQATLAMLDQLEEPVTITAFFSEDLPPHIAQTKQEFKDLIIEYASRTQGLVVYTFINPKEEAQEQQAYANGIRPVLINMREKNQVKQQKAFLGAVIQIGHKKEVIPFMQPGTAMEFALSSAIKKLSVKEKPAVVYLQGHGEPPFYSQQHLKSEIEILHHYERFKMSDANPIPDHYTTAVLLNPTTSFSEQHLQHLDNFLAKGKNLLIALSRVKADMTLHKADSTYTGLEEWLAQKGIFIENALAMDKNSVSVNVTQQTGPFRYMTQVPFPYIPAIEHFHKDHAITKDLSYAVFPFVSPISYQGDTNLLFTPLAWTSPKAHNAPLPVYFNIDNEWQDSDFPDTSLVLAGLLEGKIIGEKNAKLMVFGNGDFACEQREDGLSLPSDNIKLMVNAIEWLSDDTGLIDLRTKGIKPRPIDTLPHTQQNLLKYLNFLLPIFLAILYGLIRLRRHWHIRKQRMHYVQ